METNYATVKSTISKYIDSGIQGLKQYLNDPNTQIYEGTYPFIIKNLLDRNLNLSVEIELKSIMLK